MRANEQQNNALLGALQNILTELKALNSSSADLWDKDDIARYLTNIKELFPDLYENLNEKYRADSTNPNATADAYMDFVRGFPRQDIKGWYRQGTYKNPRADKQTATVVFDIDRENGICMERFVEPVRVKDEDGDITIRKQTFKGAFQGLVWAPPPARELKTGDEVYIVEACIDAISLQLSGYNAVASLACTNFPDKWLEKLPKGVKLIWALDNDKAGRNYMRRHIKRCKEMNFDCRAALVPDNKKYDKFDWNDARPAGLFLPKKS